MPPRSEIRPPKAILVIRLGAIGDVLLATPLIRGLAVRFPESRIDFLTKEAYIELLKTHPGLNSVIGFPAAGGFRALIETIRRIRGLRYDAVFDIQSNLRSRLFTFFSGAPMRRTVALGRFRRFLLVRFRMDWTGQTVSVPLKYLQTVRDMGVTDDGKGLDLFVDPAAGPIVLKRLEKAGIGERTRLVALAPGAGRPTKRWNAERFAAVGRHFAERGYRILILGGPKDRDVCSEVQAGLESAGKTAFDGYSVRNSKVPESSIPGSPVAGPAVHRSSTFNGPSSPEPSVRDSTALMETAALLERCALLVTNDTGLMHMASGLKVPVVAVFGPTTRHFGFFPFRSAAVVLEKDLPCRPCSFHGTERCPETHFNCMRTITAEEAVSVAERLLETE